MTELSKKPDQYCQGKLSDGFTFIVFGQEVVELRCARGSINWDTFTILLGT